LAPIATGVEFLTWTRRPLYFFYHYSKTYERHGTKPIHVCKTSNGTKRAMGVFTITAAGDFLTLIIIFKGKPGGMIEKKNCPNLTLLPPMLARMLCGWMSSA
jgi:hypothetical protein